MEMSLWRQVASWSCMATASVELAVPAFTTPSSLSPALRFPPMDRYLLLVSVVQALELHHLHMLLRM